MATSQIGNELELQNYNVNVAVLRSREVLSSTVFSIPHFQVNGCQQGNWGKHNIFIEYGTARDENE